MSTCSLYKHPMLMGTGSISNGATSVTGWTPDTRFSGKMVGRNVQITITSSTDAGKTMRNVRVTADNGSGTLTIASANPFAT